jgi:hypothetical protein
MVISLVYSDYFVTVLYFFPPQTKHAVLDIPKNTSTTGTCGNDSQVIELVWDNKDNANNNLTIVFEKDVTGSHFMIQNINLNVTPSEEFFPSVKGKLKLIYKSFESIMFSVNIYMLMITGLFFDVGVICHKCVKNLYECFIDEFHEPLITNSSATTDIKCKVL